MNEGRRTLPSVEKALQALGPHDLPRPLAVETIRRELARLRGGETIPEAEEVTCRLRAALEAMRASRLQPVINATGIVLHTNFGRAPLPARALAAIADVGAGYSNLEYDLASGERGGRGRYLEECLALLCAAEGALVVNNCAAALVLIVRHLTSQKREVLVSRGELVQIGGGFRIPEILEAAGAVLREVGTTNQTTIGDYRAALGEQTGLVLKVHRSNFFMEGFVASPTTAELAELARAAGVPLVEDLGSGALVDTSQFPAVEREPTPAAVLRQGVDLVCFSGDKLLGGPQAGIIAGRAALIDGLRRHPLLRALRCDKLVFAALQATAESYLAGSAPTEVPALALLGTGEAELRARGERIVVALAEVGVAAALCEVEAEIGAGALPRARVRSVAVELAPATESLEALAARLRRTVPPVIGYIAQNRLRLDLRTVFPEQDGQIVEAFSGARSSHSAPP